MNKIVAFGVFALMLVAMICQAGCASARQMEARDIKVVILNANTTRSLLTINQLPVHQGALSVANESDGVSLILNVRKSDNYDVEFAYESSKIEKIFRDGRNISVIYIDVGRNPQITSSSNPSLLLD